MASYGYRQLPSSRPPVTLSLLLSPDARLLARDRTPYPLASRNFSPGGPLNDTTCGLRAVAGLSSFDVELGWSLEVAGSRWSLVAGRWSLVAGCGLWFCRIFAR